MQLTINGCILLVDPFLTRPPMHNVLWGKPTSDAVLLAAKIPHADHILVTHAHYDHLMDVPEIAKRTGAMVLGSDNTCQLLQILGLPAHRLLTIHTGDEIKLPCADVRVVAGKHPFIPGYTPGRLKRTLRPPLHLNDYCMDDCFSFLVEAEDMKILIWSSISSQGALPADVLLLRAVAKERWYRIMLEQVHPRLVIPTHWDDQFRSLDQPIRPFLSPPTLGFPPIQRINLEEFTQKIHRVQPDCRVLIPHIFQMYKLRELAGL